MNILSLDWGERKVGLAWTSGSLAEPLEVIRYGHTSQLFKRLKEVIKTYGIEKIVVGISESDSAIAARNFAKVLQEELGLPIETCDETLSTFDAQEFAIQSGQSRKRRKGMEDAYAATVMLQNYLDNL